MLEFGGVIEKELSERGSFAACTTGYSMMPMLGNRRDMVILERPKRPIRKYDVVLFKDDGGRYVLHRIVKIKPFEYITRGDNNFFVERVCPDDVLAILTAFNKKGKRRNVDAFSYRLYSRFRVWNYPVRRAYRGIRVALSRIYRKFFERVGE